MLSFPKGFLWGTATSSHQVEGNNNNNQWWEFEQQPGAIWHGDRSGLACDWWRNAEVDFDLMQRLGLNAHRLSVEWSRIEPRPGEFDHAAIDRYRQMLDGLRQRGMTPLVTFHHFTNPLWLQQRGSWENVEVIPYFQRFVRYTCAALGDLCNCWVTLNEPLVYVALTYYTGIWPAQRRGFSVGMRVFRNFLLAHGAAYQTIHALQAQAQVGTAFPVRVFTGLRPGNRLDRYAAALKRYLFEQIWLMATADGRIHPPVGLGEYHHSLAGSMDFIGINYYTRDLVRFTPNPLALFGHEQFAPDAELSDQGRFKPYSQYAPDGLEQVVNEIKRFGRPIYITENGLPDRDDDQRPRWLVGHLRALHRAIQAGADVRGYFHWTFTDNFEWHEGWGLRFGLVELDPQTQERRPRPSAYLYAKIARQNGLEE